MFGIRDLGTGVIERRVSIQQPRIPNPESRPWTTEQDSR